jgi:iron(III) transport system substrate-binding protein
MAPYRFLTAGVLAGALSLTACGADSPASAPEETDQSWEAVQTRAASAGSVTVYTVAPPVQNERLVEAFNERYPDIDVEVVRGSTELPPRVSAEIEASTDGADVFIFSDPQWFADNEAHLIEAKSPASENWPTDHWAVPGTAAVVSNVPFGMLTWNTQVLPAGLSDWEGLLSPDLKGRVGMQGVINGVIAGFIEVIIEAKGVEFLENLASQDPKFYDSVVPQTQAVASGELGAGVLSVPSVVKDLQDAGAPLEYAIPEPGYAIPWAAAALSKSKRPDSARVFLDFLMSQEGQTALNGDGYGSSPLPDVTSDIDLDDDAVVFDFKQFPPSVVEEYKATYETSLGLR